MTIEKLSSYRNFFDYLYHYYSKPEFIKTDPLEFYYRVDGNKEYCAFVASIFSYGRVTSIRQFLNNFFSQLGTFPLDNSDGCDLYYRFQKSDDIRHFTQFMSNLYKVHGSLKNYFYAQSDNPEKALSRFVNHAHSFGTSVQANKGYYFLFPDTMKSSAKRMRMFLRWMVRKDAIDPGIWSQFKAADLLYPLDTHIIRFAYHNNIISSQSNSYKNTVAVTNFFKLLCSSDPVRYDFSISRLGIMYDCQYVKDESCCSCVHIIRCPF